MSIEQSRLLCFFTVATYIFIPPCCALVDLSFSSMDFTTIPTMVFGHPMVQKYILAIMMVPYLPESFGLEPVKVLISSFITGYRIRMVNSFFCSRVTFLPDLLGVCKEIGEDGHVYDILAFVVMLLVFASKLPALAKALKTYPTFRFNRTKWEEQAKDAENDECKLTEVVIVGAGIAGAALGLFSSILFHTPSSSSSSF